MRASAASHAGFFLALAADACVSGRCDDGLMNLGLRFAAAAMVGATVG